MSRRSVLMLCAFALGVLGFVLYRRPPAMVSPKEHRTEDAPVNSRRELTAPSRPTERPVERGPASDLAERHMDPEKREQLRALIWQAIGRPSPPPAPPIKRRAQYALPERPPWEDAPKPPDGADAAPVNGRIDPRYIQQRVREDFFPLARKCFEDGLAQDPTLAGTIHFAFNIVGDEKTGGIVEAVDVLNKSTLRDPDVIDCMRQSFLSISFPPPANGGEVTVIYPIVFSNDDGG